MLNQITGRLSEKIIVSNNDDTASEKYEAIANQHGGYYRHGFIDHAYLYNLYFPPESLFEKFKDQVHNLVLNYPVGQHALAELVSKAIGTPAERIVVGNGAAELINIVSGHVAEKMIIPVPSFNEYVNAAPLGKVMEFPLDFPSFDLNVEHFAAEAARVQADIAVVVSPNNPTSMLVPKADLIRLHALLEQQNCLLIVDESFLDFSDNPEGNSLEKDISKYSNLVIIKSMSKAFGICGLRIGYMLTNNSKFADTVRKGLHIWNINGFAEEFLRMLPNYRNDFLDSCKLVRKDRDLLYKLIVNIDGMTVYKPDANYIYCRLPDQSPSGPVIAKELFIRYNIYVKHCLGKTQPDSDRYLRIASRTDAENRKLAEALTDVLETWGDKDR